MALFFDVAWFETQLAERGIGRAALAAGAAMSEAELGFVFKDQRELSAAEVTAFAELLGATPAEVAERAGVSTPVPAPMTRRRDWPASKPGWRRWKRPWRGWRARFRSW
jgi:hypothetical protein